MSINRSTRLAILIALMGLALPLVVSAEEGKKKTVFPKESQAEPSEGTPTFTGKGKVTEAVDTIKGAIFDIGGGITLSLPKGLPIGHSRLLTLKTTTSRPTPSQIHPKFQRIGATLHFDGALNAARNPIVLALTAKRSPEKSGYKLVLAIEEAGLCDGKNKGSQLGHGLCSTWRTVDARYDSTGEKIVAELTSTGGYRLQFGLIPVE
jgi:hypothetical protein